MNGPIALPPDFEERVARLPPEQQAEAREYLNDYFGQLESNPLLRFIPHPKQAEYLGINTRIGAVFAGNRFGKTAVGVVSDLIQCCDRDAIPDHLLPYKRWNVEDHGPIKGRIAAPKFNENIGRVIIPAIRDWAPRNQLRGGSFDTAYAKSERVLYFANGSTIQFLTFDQDRDAHAGAALHFSHFDEEPEGEHGMGLFIENMTRLGDYDGDFRITMTPLFGLSWAYDQIFERADTDARVTVVQGGSYENPHVNRERLRLDAEMMTREERQSLRDGNFVHFAGQFYPEFGEDHRVPPPDTDHLKDQSIIVGIDPGLNYTGVVWVAFDNDNMALVFEELKPEQMVVEDVAKLIHATNKSWGIDPDYYVIDPSARNRATVNAQQVESAYQQAGIPTSHGQNDRAAGILEVKRRLQHGPGLLVSHNCPEIASEFRRYRKDPKSADEFAAVKKDDHLLDALRYVVMERMWTPPGDSGPDPLPDEWTPGTGPPAEWFDRSPDGALI